MMYNDLVYGQREIDEPVVLELLASPWLKRLKGVDQGGYPPLFINPDAKLIQTEHNRLAHSVGVYLILKKIGAPPEEQIAGLIHDVSHSAFSHAIDYVVAGGDGKEQNHQDNSFTDFVKKTDLPAIIAKHGFKLDYILDDKNFPLKENKLPDICADRIDYTIRDGLIFEEISAEAAADLLKNLAVENNFWLFKNYSTAKKFTDLYFVLNAKYYASQTDAVMYLAVSDVLKYALRKNYLKLADLYTTDDQVLEKIKAAANQDDQLKLFWRRMNDADSIGAAEKDKHDGEIFCKSRIVDPLFKDGGKLKRLSEALPGWAETVKQELKPKQYFLKYNY